MPFCFSMKIMPSYHTLSTTLKIAIHLMICDIFFTQKKPKTLRSLPPTSNLSHGHTLRSHYAVFICSNLIPAPDTNLNPIGWNSVDSVLIPINVSLNYHICTLIFVATRRKCTRKCQCSKFGASCTVSCKQRRRMLYLSLLTNSVGHCIRQANIFSPSEIFPYMGRK